MLRAAACDNGTPVLAFRLPSRLGSTTLPEESVSDDERERDAKRALERVKRDAETLGGSGIARAGERLGRHFAGRDAPVEAEGAADWAEVWGRRIGRALSLVGVVVLAYLLGVQLKLW